MDSSEFQFQFIHLNSVSSTNIYALELLRQKSIKEGTVITANFQEKGKGQLGKVWEADKDKNLQFSVIISPKINIEHQFQLSKLVAISLKKWLDTLAVEGVKIKWPNDILVKGKKIAGVLIENNILKQQITHSVIGIGVNVDQESFGEFDRPATSLRLELQRTFDVKDALNRFLEIFKSYYLSFLKGELNLQDTYLKDLFGYGVPQRYQDAGGDFLGVILGVLPSGKLQVNRNGKLKSYDLKELKFLD
jgi:BirA family biotin operon repressor/biotin-[acetyl-CoA-carboxylase] ligase